MKKGETTKKPIENIVFLDSSWVPYVVRRMSFWHQSLSLHGYSKRFPDFGIEKGIEIISITLDGVRTHTFVREPNFSEVGRLIKNIWLTPGGFTHFPRLFKKYAKELHVALARSTKNLTKKGWEVFLDRYRKFTVALSITAVFGRFGAEELTQELSRLGFGKQEIPNIIATATYPKEHTPLFLSQLDLYRLAVSAKKKNWDAKKKDSALKKWLKKCQHVPVNFCEEPWTIADARNQLAHIEAGDPEKGLVKLLADHDARVRAATEMTKRIGDKSVVRLVHAIAEATILNEFRKGVFCKVSLEYRFLFKIVAERGGSQDWRDCFYLTPEEMTELLFGQPFKIVERISARKVTGHYVVGGEVGELPEETLQDFLNYINTYSGLGQKASGIEVTEIRGFSASKGKVRGTVKILFGPKDFAKMNRGDILVAPATSVDFVPVMEKAAAFVTNEGGITSHASIVSREMGKPCIIGTKIATSVLRDGDVVEVDAEKGVVKILKKYDGK